MTVDRLALGLRKMSPGALGGQSRVATPVHRRPPFNIQTLRTLCEPPAETAFDPQFVRDSSNGTPYTNGVPFDYGIYSSSVDTTNVLFVVTPDSVDLDIELFTEIHRVVWPNTSDIGDVRFTVWTLPGPNVDTSIAVTLTGLEFNPWTIIYGQLPFTDAVVVAEGEIDFDGNFALTNPDGGPVLGAAVSMGSDVNLTVDLPASGEYSNTDWINVYDSYRADVASFASSSPGPITGSGAFNTGPTVLVGFSCG